MQPIQFFAARAEDGALLPGATVDVFVQGTQGRAPLFADSPCTVPLGNPVSADANARVFFYTTTPRIDMRISRYGYVAPMIVDISTWDAATAVEWVQSEIDAALGEIGNSLEEMEHEFSVSQIDKEQRFQQFLLSSGYQLIGEYSPELLITERNQIFLKDGEFYRAGAALALPYMTTGVWTDEFANFVAVGDAALRQELGSPNGSSLNGFIQSGVGALPRTAQDKMRDIVSVRDFGAVGDGVTDSAAAFVKASSAFGQVVHVPMGSYLVHLTQANAASILDLLRRIRVDGFLSIVVPTGLITLTQQVVIDSPDLNLIQILGPAPVSKIVSSMASVTGAAKAYSVTLNIPDTAGITIGDYAIVRDVSGTGDYYAHNGIWKITAIGVGQVTVLNTHHGAAFPVGSITVATLIVLKARFQFIGCDGFRLEGVKALARFEQFAIVGDWSVAAGTGTLGAHGVVMCLPVITNGADSNANFSPSGNGAVGPLLGVSGFGEQGIVCAGRSHLVANYVASSSSRKRGWYAEGGHIRAKSTISSGNGEDGFISDVGGSIRNSQSVSVGNGLNGYIAINLSFIGAGTSRSTGNLNNGYEVRGPGRMEVPGARALNNGSSGFAASYGGMIQAPESEGSGNGVSGYDAATGIIDALTSTSRNNVGYGYRSQYGSTVRATESVISGNGAGPYYSRDGGVLFEAGGAVSVLNVPTYSVGQRVYDSAKAFYYGFSTNSVGDLLLSAGANPEWVYKADGVFHPSVDNGPTIGRASNRPSVLFAGTGTINTSDGREKTDVRQFLAAELKAGLRLANELGIYQWLVEIGKKGVDGARLHVGMTVQRAMAILEEEGLDPYRYGLICHDTWGDEYETVPAAYDASGELVTEAYERLATAAGDRFGFRENELHALMIRSLAHEQALIKERLVVLEMAGGD